ncbi:C-terminal domain of homeodomain 1-domain-containing protein [Collybia nuda]|uniref:C-terminal domain of homeodomain 1-domain-containing protein n=1 Tax=Collybia nuda TaxID=64659 RepID=A0A9P6CFC4_9AGAR|nr:C-terminal domain of homeodomain 1-domain-containing protein [Collybia nuda]
MPTSLHDRLLHVEEQFFIAINEGGTALSAFDNMWSSISIDLDQAVRTGAIDDETFTLGNSVSLRIAILSDYLLEFQNSADAMSLSLQDSLESIFARVEISDTPQPDPYSSHISSSHDPSPSHLCPASSEARYTAYITRASSWLLQNLHNPYPSKTLRDAISYQTNSPRSAIDAWFIDARKRIGWNTLRQRHFSNKRVDIVDSASRFFLDTDPNQPLDSTIAISFATIEANAKDLYSDKFTESALAVKLDAAVRDLTPRIKSRAKVDERRRKTQRSQARNHRRELSQVALSYPSPHPSPSSTPEPALSSDELEMSRAPLMSTANRKRKSRDAIDSDPEPYHGRLNKRSRLNIYSDIEASAKSLPSPTPSIEATLPTINFNSFMNSPAPPVVPLSRKRRLSDNDGPPKLPWNISSSTRFHTVSNPLPCSPALSAWFENHFGIHTAASTDEHDLSSLVDVEFYDYSNNSRELNPPLEITDMSNDSRSQLESTVPSSDAHHPTLDVQSFPSNTPANNRDFNGPCQGLESPTSKTPVQDFSNKSDPSTFKPSHSSSGVPATAPDLPVIVDFSASTHHNSISSYDWILPSFSPSWPILNSHLSQYPASIVEPADHTVDFFCDTLPAAWRPMESEKAVKRRKLMEMKEASRRLEAEIAAL